MTITKEQKENSLTIYLEGRLDTVTAPMLEKINDELDGITDLTLDFSKLGYTSSAGLRAILMLQKRMNQQGKMRLVGVCEDIQEVFDMTGFSDILTIE